MKIESYSQLPIPSHAVCLAVVSVSRFCFYLVKVGQTKYHITALVEKMRVHSVEKSMGLDIPDEVMKLCIIMIIIICKDANPHQGGMT